MESLLGSNFDGQRPTCCFRDLRSRCSTGTGRV